MNPCTTEGVPRHAKEGATFRTGRGSANERWEVLTGLVDHESRSDDVGGRFEGSFHSLGQRDDDSRCSIAFLPVAPDLLKHRPSF